MTNQEALALLDTYAKHAQNAVQASVWAQAYLTEGGEGTWDAVKSVTAGAVYLSGIAREVVALSERFEEITPSAPIGFASC